MTGKKSYLFDFLKSKFTGSLIISVLVLFLSFSGCTETKKNPASPQTSSKPSKGWKNLKKLLRPLPVV